MKVSEQTVSSEALRAYLAIAGNNPDKKYELIQNEIIEMAGGSPEHSQIAHLILHFLTAQLLDSNQYSFYNSDLGIVYPDGSFLAYPDGSVCFGETQRVNVQGNDCMTNPCLILEVLSESTKTRDRNVKREAYQRIPSLQTYLLAELEAPRVELYERDGDDWRHDVFEGLDAAFTVLGGAAQLRLEDVYRGVNFENY